jgi:hypothetical protein
MKPSKRRKKARKREALAALLKGISARNCHAAVEWGSARGREAV